jgi:hypothetical protein
MVRIPISLDPLIWDALQRWSNRRGGSAAGLVRDLIYTALLEERASPGGRLLARALKCPKLLSRECLRVKGSKIVNVDESGIEIFPDK